MQLYQLANIKVLDYPPTHYPWLIANFIVDNSELSGLYLPIPILDAYICIYVMPTYTFVPNLLVNDSSLSMVGVDNPTVPPNTHIMATSKNVMDTFMNIADDNIYIMVNVDVYKYPWYEPTTQFNGLSLFYVISVKDNYYNYLMHIFHPNDVPYEDNIPDTEVVYER